MLLGIDLGGTKVAYALARSDGEILARSRTATPQSGDPEADVEAIVATARKLCEDNGVRALERVGLSAPGPLDRSTGRILGPPNLSGWTDVPIVAWLESGLGCPVRLENDANAGALAEWRAGAGRGSKEMIYLTMSTGVGGGLILDGKLYRGHGGGAGEVGHVPVEWPGVLCACGLRGCLEAYVGGGAWSAHLRASGAPDGRTARLAGGIQRVLPEHLLEAAREDDPWAVQEMTRFNAYLARGLVQLAFLLAPERIVLGTIAAAAGDRLCLDPLREELARSVWPQQVRGLSIVASELGLDLAHQSSIAVALGESDRR